MSKRVENLRSLLDLIDKVDLGVNYVADAIETKIEEFREVVTDKYDEAVMSEAHDDATEQKARETFQTFFDNLKKFTDDPKIKSFYDSVVNPAADPGPVPSEPTREDKIAAVKAYYLDKYGINVWPNASNLSEEVVDSVFNAVSQ